MHFYKSSSLFMLSDSQEEFSNKRYHIMSNPQHLPLRRSSSATHGDAGWTESVQEWEILEVMIWLYHKIIPPSFFRFQCVFRWRRVFWAQPHTHFFAFGHAQRLIPRSGKLMENNAFLRRSRSFAGGSSNSPVLMRSLIKAAPAEFITQCAEWKGSASSCLVTWMLAS